MCLLRLLVTPKETAHSTRKIHNQDQKQKGRHSDLLPRKYPTNLPTPSYLSPVRPTSPYSYEHPIRDRNFELQKERERQHESVMGEVRFVQTLKEKLAPPPPPPPPPPPAPAPQDTKEKDPPKPTETEKRMMDEMGKLVGLVNKREREDEIERAVRRGREEGVRAGRESAGIGIIGGGTPIGGWAGHFAANPRLGAYDAYISQQRRRSSVSETARNVASRVVDRMDRIGDRLGRDMERVSDRVWGVERGVGEFERELSAREFRRERERAVERLADMYPPFGRRWL